MKFSILLLLLVSCGGTKPEKTYIYHGIDANIICEDISRISHGGARGYDCMSVSSGNKYEVVYNLTNVVKLEVKND